MVAFYCKGDRDRFGGPPRTTHAVAMHTTCDGYWVADPDLRVHGCDFSEQDKVDCTLLVIKLAAKCAAAADTRWFAALMDRLWEILR